MIKKINIFVISMVSLISCSDNINSPNYNNLFPLAIGNKWIYFVQEYDTLSQIETKSYYDTIEVLTDTTINSQTYYIFNHFPRLFYPVRNNSHGFYLINMVDKKEYLLFKSNVSIRDTYSIFLPLITILDTKFKINTIIGNFTCIVYQIERNAKSSNDDPFIYYIAPENGLIQFKQYWRNREKLYLLKNMILEKKFIY